MNNQAFLDELNTLNQQVGDMQRRIVKLITVLSQQVHPEPAAPVAETTAAQASAELIANATDVPQARQPTVVPVATHLLTAEDRARIPQMLLKPTVEGQPAATGPTVEGHAGDNHHYHHPAQSESSVLEQRTREQLKNFYGNGSLFARFLSSVIITGGKGMVKPGFKSFEQYAEDITAPSLDALRAWPTGFYRNKQTKNIQFFLQMPGLMVYVDHLPDNSGRPVFIELPLNEKSVKITLDELKLTQLMRYRDMMDAQLMELNL